VDFFASQELARKNTRKLIVLLILTVISLIAAVYALVLAIFVFAGNDSEGGKDIWAFLQSAENLQIIAVVVIGVVVIVGCGMIYKTSELRAGGPSVANLLGGKRILPNTSNFDERRLLNVVEEMALASGIPVPPVYVLDKEPGINAFAAGHTIDDAVIGVNRGTLEKLNREELQGVIGHEFSHILNGDMRMSLRMIGLLHGILVIALIGYQVLRLVGHSSSGSSSKKGEGGAKAAFLALGAGLLVIGYIGLFFARLIKASVSRQREYLADASSVQFTRNPGGISGALKMIGANQETSRVQQSNAETISHMFFANMTGSMLSNAFSTHPPLVPRIQRVDPRFDGQFMDYAKRRTKSSADDADEKDDKKKKPSGFDRMGIGPRFSQGQAPQGMPFDPVVLVAATGDPTEEDLIYSRFLIDRIPNRLQSAIRDVFLARCLVFASLLDKRVDIRESQLRILSSHENDATVAQTLEMETGYDAIDVQYRLPMFEILQGTLAGLSDKQYRTFRNTVGVLIQADKSVSLFEFFLQHHLISHLDRHFGHGLPQRVQYEQIEPLREEVGLLLGIFAEFGHTAEEPASAAFEASIQSLPPSMKSLKYLSSGWDYPKLALAVKKLSLGSPAVKKKFLEAAAISIAFDREITIIEAEMYRAMGESLDCPIPPIMALKSIDRGTTNK
jgi:Zn-dependent protease with chaperone function